MAATQPQYDEQDFLDVAEVLFVGGNPRRLAVLHACLEERTVADIASHVGITVPAASQHLKNLREFNLVKKRGSAHYTAATEGLPGRRVEHLLAMLGWTE